MKGLKSRLQSEVLVSAEILLKLRLMKGISVLSLDQLNLM